jgi:hypothetical protein
MALDFSRVKKAQTDLQSRGEKKDYSKIYYKPIIGKQKIRIVPWKEDPTFPFITAQLHKYDTFKRYIPTLANWGEADPILKFKDKVLQSPKATKDDKDLMRNLYAKTTTFVQVIVRGQEDQGVRLWELNKTNLESIMAIVGEEDEYGDVTSVADGRDLIIEGHNEVNPQTGKSYVGITIKVSVNKTPLSANAETVKKWLTEQLAPLDQYKRLTAEELKVLLENFLNPADGSEDGEEEAPAPKAAPKAPAKAPVKPVFTKVVAEEPEVDPELAGEEVEAPAPPPVVKKAVAKPKAKPVPVVEEVDPELVDEDPITDAIDGDDELSEAIPKTPKVAPKVTVKPPVAKAPVTAAGKFSALFQDDED